MAWFFAVLKSQNKATSKYWGVLELIPLISELSLVIGQRSSSLAGLECRTSRFNVCRRTPSTDSCKSALLQESEHGADIPHSLSSWPPSLVGLLSNLAPLCNSTGLGSDSKGCLEILFWISFRSQKGLSIEDATDIKSNCRPVSENRCRRHQVLAREIVLSRPSSQSDRTFKLYRIAYNSQSNHG
ncbi:uncharacterized protein BP01DRAFT_220101 [Aspergillus saccharolyticus JOP 1030-1]|uniref:Uncharacterized protein n=1 Tax=Aspergillus saccharolyticus JOP 1030-1 TaxID=1450539 RepID=A0A319A6I1_9EURO|nr:hypothetical protein BP01DRAFT_220101 [Aspergillus saccharolyticus JOP 1030-1]PYH47608.1 hypothetical protein BP01DRAFT_220101 [Aspergillus saccharolyticus JOP 1030-1]